MCDSPCDTHVYVCVSVEMHAVPIAFFDLSENLKCVRECSGSRALCAIHLTQTVCACEIFSVHKKPTYMRC